MYYETRLVEELHKAGPCTIWRVVNACASGDIPDSRGEERNLRLEYLRAVKVLLKRRTLRRLGRKGIYLPREQSLAKEYFARPLCSERNHSNCRVGSAELGRQYGPPESASTRTGTLQIGRNLAIKPKLPNPIPCSGPSQTQSVPAEPGLVSTAMMDTPFSAASIKDPEHERQKAAEAGRTLRKLPRHVPRRWTGWIGNHHCWRGSQILLPGGKPAFAFGVLRGRIIWTLHPGKLVGGFDGEPFQWGVVRAADVTPQQHPAAVLLGRLKAGVKERKSALKSETARQNGRQPCRPGRRRGRPRGNPARTVTT